TASPGSGITIGGWIEVLNEQTEGTLPNISCSRTGNYTITATFGSTTSTNLPCTPHQLTLSVDHAYISPGHPGTLTGNVSPQYPTGTSNQLTVSVSPTSAASAGNISIPANATTGTSQVTANSVSEPTLTTITATDPLGTTATAQVTVLPANADT